MDKMDTICENCDICYDCKKSQEKQIKDLEFEILYLRNCLEDMKRQLRYMGFYDNPIMYAPH